MSKTCNRELKIMSLIAPSYPVSQSVYPVSLSVPTDKTSSKATHNNTDTPNKLYFTNMFGKKFIVEFDDETKLKDALLEYLKQAKRELYDELKVPSAQGASVNGVNGVMLLYKTEQGKDDSFYQFKAGEVSLHESTRVRDVLPTNSIFSVLFLSNEIGTASEASEGEQGEQDSDLEF